MFWMRTVSVPARHARRRQLILDEKRARSLIASRSWLTIFPVSWPAGSWVTSTLVGHLAGTTCSRLDRARPRDARADFTVRQALQGVIKLTPGHLGRLGEVPRVDTLAHVQPVVNVNRPQRPARLDMVKDRVELSGLAS